VALGAGSLERETVLDDHFVGVESRFATTSPSGTLAKHVFHDDGKVHLMAQPVLEELDRLDAEIDRHPEFPMRLIGNLNDPTAWT
jgi:hypothetical protein